MRTATIFRCEQHRCVLQLYTSVANKTTGRPQSRRFITTDSNVWGGASGYTYAFTRRHDGTTDVDVVIVRDGKNLKGRMLGFAPGTVDKRVLETAFENSVKAANVRNSPLGRHEMVAAAARLWPSLSRLAIG